jgi:hypothetical protein
VSGEQGAKVELGPISDGQRTGFLSLLVRNTGKTQADLTLRYLRDNGEPPVMPGEDANDVTITLLHPPIENLRVPPRSVRQFSLKFKLAGEDLPGDLDGQIVLRSETAAGAKSGDMTAEPKVQEIVVPVVAQLAPIEGVSFQPSSITVQAVKGKLWPGGDDATATVRIYGPGVSAFLAAHPDFVTSALLRDDEHEIVVVFDELQAEGDEVATGTIHSESQLYPGEYEGNLLLSQSHATPALEVTFRSHHWFPWLLLVVLAGSLLGGLLPLYAGVWRRKELMRAELAGLVDAYQLGLRGKTTPEDPERPPPPLWDLTDAVGDLEDWETDKWLAMPDLYGVKGLASSIHWARTKEELDELGDKIIALSARIQRWLRFAEPVRDLEAASKQTGRKLDDKYWEDTHVPKDTKLLLLEAREEPEKDDAAAALLRRIIQQTAWHSAVLDFWNELSGALDRPDLSEGQRKQIRTLAWDKVVFGDEAKTEAKRTPAERRAAAVTLEARRRELDRILRPDRPAIEYFLEGFGALPSVKNAMGWVTGTVGGGVMKVIEARVGAAMSKRPRSIAERVAAVTRQQIALTALAWISAVIVYAVAEYGPAWGTITDYLTAFTAGFGASVVMQWATQPIFERLRLGKASGGAPTSPPPAGGAGQAGQAPGAGRQAGAPGTPGPA